MASAKYGQFARSWPDHASIFSSVTLPRLTVPAKSMMCIVPGVGDLVGRAEGLAVVGKLLGERVGESDGAPVGDSEGLAVGRKLGAAVGELLGRGLGLAVGAVVGEVDGWAVGSFVGLTLGYKVGLALGIAVGHVLGLHEGEDVGEVVGASVLHVPRVHLPRHMPRASMNTLEASPVSYA